MSSRFRWPHRKSLGYLSNSASLQRSDQYRTFRVGVEVRRRLSGYRLVQRNGHSVGREIRRSTHSRPRGTHRAGFLRRLLRRSGFAALGLCELEHCRLVSLKWRPVEVHWHRLQTAFDQLLASREHKSELVCRPVRRCRRQRKPSDDSDDTRLLQRGRGHLRMAKAKIRFPPSLWHQQIPMPRHGRLSRSARWRRPRSIRLYGPRTDWNRGEDGQRCWSIATADRQQRPAAETKVSGVR